MAATQKNAGQGENRHCIGDSLRVKFRALQQPFLSAGQTKKQGEDRLRESMCLHAKRPVQSWCAARSLQHGTNNVAEALIVSLHRLANGRCDEAWLAPSNAKSSTGCYHPTAPRSLQSGPVSAILERSNSSSCGLGFWNGGQTRVHDPLTSESVTQCLEICSGRLEVAHCMRPSATPVHCANAR